jgi:hypothetical protein
LVRVEGNNYKLPTRFEDRVEVNPVMKHVELFDVYHQKDKVLVFLKQKGEEPITFMIQGVSKPIVKKVVKKKPIKQKPSVPNKTTPGEKPSNTIPKNTPDKLGEVSAPSGTETPPIP